MSIMENIREQKLSSTNNESVLIVRLHSIRYEAPDINTYIFRSLQGQHLPAFSAGAHIDLHLAPHMIRSYSLINTPDQCDYYAISVKRESSGRGGSQFVHDTLRVGQELTIGRPSNDFPLRVDAAFSVFFAGGIGITPILCMVMQLEQLGQNWELHYATRSRNSAAFLNQLEKLGPQVHLYFDDEVDLDGSQNALDIESHISSLPEEVHLYCCGPLPMLSTFEAATANRSNDFVHLEYFKSNVPAATTGGYEVVLQKSDQTLFIAEGQSILDAVLEIGIDIPFSCMDGVCGSCETRVIEGTPDHRDLVLSKEERDQNNKMMICCSGSKTDKLILDL